MALTIRSIVAFAIPALGAIVSLIWYRNQKKKRNELDYPKEPDKILTNKDEQIKMQVAGECTTGCSNIEGNQTSSSDSGIMESNQMSHMKNSNAEGNKINTTNIIVKDNHSSMDSSIIEDNQKSAKDNRNVDGDKVATRDSSILVDSPICIPDNCIVEGNLIAASADTGVMGSNQMSTTDTRVTKGNQVCTTQSTSTLTTPVNYEGGDAMNVIVPHCASKLDRMAEPVTDMCTKAGVENNIPNVCTSHALGDVSEVTMDKFVESSIAEDIIIQKKVNNVMKSEKSTTNTNEDLPDEAYDSQLFTPSQKTKLPIIKNIQESSSPVSSDLNAMSEPLQSSNGNKKMFSWADSVENAEISFHLEKNNTTDRVVNNNSMDATLLKLKDQNHEGYSDESLVENGTKCDVSAQPPVETSPEGVQQQQSGANGTIRQPATTSESPRSSSSNGSSDAGSSDLDVCSEVSVDSGHGGSVVEASSLSGVSSPMPVVFGDEKLSYEFNFPTRSCGQMIGKYGRNINHIKDVTGVEISIKRKIYTDDFQLVILEGTQSQIDKCLGMLREKFPSKRYPEITFDRISSESPVLYPEMMQLSLPGGVSVEVLVSSVVAPNHLFLQQPTHPSFHMLERLNQCMNLCYEQDGVVPQLPRPIEVGVICAAPMYNTGWYRAQVVQIYPDSDEVDIKFVDYGGYLRVTGCMLRQIRSDFALLPFQAVECYMANVIPPKGEEFFAVECIALMEQLVQGKLLQAQVVGHEENGVPYIQLYDLQGDKMTLINRELVNIDVAQWMEHLL